MSENGNHESTEASKASITFDVFEAFYKQNPDLDNAEYYKQYPTVNQGTVRSWKAKARSNMVTVEPDQQSTDKKGKYQDIIKTLVTLTKINTNLLKGLDEQSQLNVLKNYAAQLKDKTTPDPNIGFIPTPARSSKRTLGLDQYITFDSNKGIIRMAIPATVAHDPEKNKKLGEYIEQ